MRKLTIALVVTSFLLFPSVSFSGKSDSEKTEQTEVKELTDYLTPMDSLRAKYYEIVAQIKQKDIEIEVLEKQLERLDAIMGYQRDIQKRIEMDKQKEEEKETKK